MIDIAIPLGLIINELISNIFKHAFSEHERGKILVKLFKENEGFIHFTISDNGKGVSNNFNFNEQRSLGMQTVYALGEQQLNGKITFVSKKGLRIDLVFPEQLYLERI